LDIDLPEKYKGAVVQRPSKGFLFSFFQPGDRILVEKDGRLLPGVVSKLRKKFIAAKLAMYEDTPTVVLVVPDLIQAAVRLARQTAEDQKLSLYYVELEKQRVKAKGERRKANKLKLTPTHVVPSK
jgi:hypothetical protein